MFIFNNLCTLGQNLTPTRDLNKKIRKKKEVEKGRDDQNRDPAVATIVAVGEWT